MRFPIALLVATLMFVAGGLKAQSFTVNNTFVSSQGFANQYVFYNHLLLDNLTDSTLNLRWVYEFDSIPANWDTKVQDPVDFWPAGTDSADFELVDTAAVASYILVHFFPNHTPGKGEVHLRVYDVDSPFVSYKLRFFGWARDTVASSIGLLSPEQISVSPNPSHSTINIDLPLNEQVHSLQLVDTKGALHTPAYLQKANSIEVVIEQLPAGVYQLQLATDKGQYWAQLLKY